MAKIKTGKLATDEQAQEALAENIMNLGAANASLSEAWGWAATSAKAVRELVAQLEASGDIDTLVRIVNGIRIVCEDVLKEVESRSRKSKSKRKEPTK